MRFEGVDEQVDRLCKGKVLTRLDDDQRGERARVDEMKPLDREAVLGCRGGEPLPELMLTQRDRPPASGVARRPGAPAPTLESHVVLRLRIRDDVASDAKWLTPA